MNYQKLKYSQYFIDTSNDYNDTGDARFYIEYKDIKYIYKGRLCHANYEVHYEPERNVIQINFEETNGKKDWFVNFMFVEKYYDSFIWEDKKITLRVHNGWAAMYKAMKHYVRNEFWELKRRYPTANVEIIGWSLGSSQAMLCAQDLNYNYGIKPHLYTYGSVNPFKTNIFNRHKIKKYLRDCCNEVYNFCDVNDIVTYLPPRLFGFIKIKKAALDRPLLFWRLFNPWKYHTHYDNDDLYKRVYKKDRRKSWRNK